MKTEQYKSLFDKYYKQVYQLWRVDENKAPKDIVGQEYEKFRKALYEMYGFETKKEKLFSFVPDLIVQKEGKLLLIEEDKGHYVDACFLKRAMVNFAEVINSYGASSKDIPYFCLSCPTKLNNFEEHFNRTIEVFREDIQQVMKERFVYFAVCDHDRVNAKKYFQSKENCFILNEEMIHTQLNFLEQLGAGRR